MSSENWGYQIGRLREAKGLTQADLAAKSGLSSSYLSRLEGGHYKSMKNASHDTLQKLATGLSMSVASLHDEIAGHQAIRPESPQDILERLRRITPMRIPIYPWESFPYHAGDPVQPTDYVYRLFTEKAPRAIEGYVVHGDCLSPTVRDNDVVIVDRAGTIEHGDIAICTTDHHLCIGEFRKIGDMLWLETNKERFPLGDCRVVAPVIEVIRRLK